MLLLLNDNAQLSSPKISAFKSTRQELCARSSGLYLRLALRLTPRQPNGKKKHTAESAVTEADFITEIGFASALEARGLT